MCNWAYFSIRDDGIMFQLLLIVAMTVVGRKFRDRHETILGYNIRSDNLRKLVFGINRKSVRRME